MPCPAYYSKQTPSKTLTPGHHDSPFSVAVVDFSQTSVEKAYTILYRLTHILAIIEKGEQLRGSYPSIHTTISISPKMKQEKNDTIITDKHSHKDTMIYSVYTKTQKTRQRTCCGIDSRSLPRSLAAVGEVVRVEREKLLAGGDGTRARGSGRTGGVHGILLRSPREPGVDGSGETGGSQFLP